MKKHIRWYTLPTIYVDIETGETLTKTQVKQHYIKIKTDTYHVTNYNKTIGHRQSTIKCARDLKLEYRDD